MSNSKSTVDNREVTKFDHHAKEWWDLDGPLKTLHDINNARLEYIDGHLSLNQALVLDVGCGGGVLTEGMAKLGAKATGIDASYQAILTAKEHAKLVGLPIDYECVPIEEYEHQGFDAITCMEMLEHVQNPALVIEHCKRLLKPDGVLFLSTINRTLKAYTSVILAAEYILGVLPKQTHEYSKFIKPSELASMGRTVGLEVLDMKGLSYNPILRTASLIKDVSVNYLLVLKLSL